MPVGQKIAKKKGICMQTAANISFLCNRQFCMCAQHFADIHSFKSDMCWPHRRQTRRPVDSERNKQKKKKPKPTALVSANNLRPTSM